MTAFGELDQVVSVHLPSLEGSFPGQFDLASSLKRFVQNAGIPLVGAAAVRATPAQVFWTMRAGNDLRPRRPVLERIHRLDDGIAMPCSAAAATAPDPALVTPACMKIRAAADHVRSGPPIRFHRWTARPFGDRVRAPSKQRQTLARKFVCSATNTSTISSKRWRS